MIGVKIWTTKKKLVRQHRFCLSLDLCRAGILVGPSSGFALAGLYQHLEKQNFSDVKEKIAVFICPDSPLPYIDEYFAFLEKEDFPSIQNEHLLKNKEVLVPQKSASDKVEEIEPERVLQVFFGTSKNEISSAFDQKRGITLTKYFQIIDTRDTREFEDHHIPHALHVPYYEFDAYLKKNKRKLKKQKGVLFVCRHGNISRFFSYKAQMLGIQALSLKGGDTEWSRLDFPRTRATKCTY